MSTPQTTPAATNNAQAAPNSYFSRSIVISAVRCTLSYVMLPFVTPLIGLAPGVGPAIGIPIAVVALWANVASIRRFWASNHRWKWPVGSLNAGIIVLLLILLFVDFRQLGWL